MTDQAEQRPPTDAPAAYRTARRPGQSGEQNQRSAGPSPLSPNPTGPHPPYEPHDPEGLASGKHIRPEAAVGTVAGDRKVVGKGLLSPDITVVGHD